MDLRGPGAPGYGERHLAHEDQLRAQEKKSGRSLGFGAQGLGFRVLGVLGAGIWGLGLRVQGLGFRV